LLQAVQCIFFCEAINQNYFEHIDILWYRMIMVNFTRNGFRRPKREAKVGSIRTKLPTRAYESYPESSMSQGNYMQIAIFLHCFLAKGKQARAVRAFRLCEPMLA
jgi:hypothetical protein